NISSGADTTIFASNLTASGEGNIIVGAYTDNNPFSATYGQTIFNDNANLNIINGVDSERFYSKSTKIKTGLSLENALMTAAMVAAVAFSGGAGAAVIATSGAVGGAVGSVNQQKTTKTQFRYDETIVKSNLSFGKNLNLTSINDTNIQSSNLATGTKNIIGQKDLNITTGGNLLLTSATETHQVSYDLKDKGNYFFKNGQSGNYNTAVINTEIDTANGEGNLNLNVGNSILTSYKQGSREDTSNQKLAYLNQLDPAITTYNSIEETHKSWDQTVSGLTSAGQAVVAITATALTMGAMDPVSGSWVQGALVAGTSATASTASVSAINSAMNANGDIFKQLKTISKDTWDNTTSRESVKNIIIASVSAGIATGLTNIVGGGTFTTPATNSANKIASNTNTLERVSTNLKTSFQEISTQTLASTATQSAINGDSFIESLKNQSKNVLIYTLAKVGANEIGRAYHGTTTPTILTDSNGNTLTNLDGNIMTTTSSPLIDKPTQLLLHATLGCAV
ncbi:MAG: hypothetical protein EBT63_07150, partial [Proteobacteria bacterium]|nr:hypothetical protein [Pseudomonadota bacterium]